MTPNQIKELYESLKGLYDFVSSECGVKEGDDVFFIDKTGEIKKAVYTDSLLFDSLAAMGNLFKTEKIASDNKDVIMEKWKRL